ncbi:MAG: DUF58 domain-containing protein [Actinobacteria bacterium]|nr:DUF58 domain-containing protein [Actinomycetota bacterium]
MTPATADAIPLYPRRRLLGTSSGGSTSLRRGGRADVASSRPYRPGDHFGTIDWKSSARLSSARGSDEFIVREQFAEEIPAVVLVVDRCPGMALYPAGLPWLHKPAAVRATADVLIASAHNQRSLLAYLDFASHPGQNPAGTPFWEPPRAHGNVWQAGLAERLDEYLDLEFDAPQDSLERSLVYLTTVRSSVPIGSFVFVLSDFIDPPPIGAWAQAVERGWDLVPVIVQDPVWEQSFPAIEDTLVPFADARGEGMRHVRLSESEVAARRSANEQRLSDLNHQFVRFGIDPVVIGDASPDAVHAALLDWSQSRVTVGRGR